MSGIHTYAEIISAFCDFLVVSTHTILYQRNIYPKTAFLLTRKYNYPIRQCRHPRVCTWITDAVGAIRDELIVGSIARIVVAIHDSQQKVLERFVFDTESLPVVERTEMHTTIERSLEGKARPIVDLEEQFRGALATLTRCSSVLTPIPDDCSFTIAMEQKDAADPPLSHATPWIPVDPPLQRRVENVDGLRYESSRGSELGGTAMHPVKSVDTGDIAFEMWIEEGSEKMSSVSETSSQPVSSANWTG